MTTPLSKSPQVLGVLLDPQFLFERQCSDSDTVDEVIQHLWRTTSERVDDDDTSEKQVPSVVQVLLGEIGPFTHSKILTLVPESNLNTFKPNEATFPALTAKDPQETYIVLFGMPSSWSSVVSKRDKENVVTGMSNLSIEDSKGNKKVAGGSNKLKGEEPQFSRWLPLTERRAQRRQVGGALLSRMTSISNHSDKNCWER